jgi:tetratricopeptide (TPR) repeat protein
MRRADLAQAYLFLGMSYKRLGRLSEALSTYQLASNLFPKDINLLSELGDILHQAGLDEQASPIFDKVLSIHPNNARGHLGLAEIDRRLGLLEESADHYERALELMPDQAGLWRDYAEVLLGLRDLKTAELAIRKSLALVPEPDSLVDLALIQRAGGRVDDALSTMEQAFSAAPQRDDIALARGVWLLEAGRYEDAKAAAASRLQGDDKDPLALWIQARARLHDGHREQAIKDLRLAAGAVRSNPFIARAAKALLEQLESK